MTSIAQPVVVVIDDESQVLAALRRSLSREPYRVVTTQRPAEALDLIERDGARLVIADQRMPSMTGIELLKAVRLRSPSTRRLMLTAYPEHPAVAEEAGEAAQRVLTKPWDDDELRETIRQVLDAPASPPASQPDFRDLLLFLDCRDRDSNELIDRAERALYRSEAAFKTTAILVHHLWSIGDSLNSLLTGLGSAVRRAGVRALLVDRSGFGSAYLTETDPDGPLAAYVPPSRFFWSRRVLLVQHHDEAVEFSRSVLQAAGHSVVARPWTAEATLLMETQPFDVVFVDLETPDAIDLDVCNRFFDRNPDVTVVPIIRQLTPAVGRELLRRGLSLRLVKPFSAKELLDGALPPER